MVPRASKDGGDKPIILNDSSSKFIEILLCYLMSHNIILYVMLCYINLYVLSVVECYIKNFILHSLEFNTIICITWHACLLYLPYSLFSI